MKKNEILKTITPLIKNGETDRDELIGFIKEAYPKKIGRKRIPEAQKKVNIMIRIPAQEKEEYLIEAKQKGISLSKLLRNKLHLLQRCS